jgi:hypothetical protein
MGHFVFRDSRRFYLQACHSVNKGALDVWKAGMLGDGALDSAIGHEFGRLSSSFVRKPWRDGYFASS